MAVTILGDNSVSVVIVDGPSVSVNLPADSGASSVSVSSGVAPLPVVVTDGPSISVDVAQSQLSGVDVYGGIGPTIFVNGTMTGVIGTIGINPFLAGPNITISTAGGSITVIGRDPPVYSVQGKTGTVSLVVADLTAAAASHTHSTTDISGLTTTIKTFANVYSVQGKTGTVSLVVADLTAAAASHTHSTTDISGLTTTIRSVSPVFSVQGKTGTVSLVVADLTAAAASHTHSTTDISGLTTTIQAFSHVFSVQGKTGTVSLVVADLTAAAASHTHSTTDISGLTTTIKSFANVFSVQGKTGTVTLSGDDIVSSVDGYYVTTDDTLNQVVFKLDTAIDEKSDKASVLGLGDLPSDVYYIAGRTSTMDARFPLGLGHQGKGLIVSNENYTKIATSDGFVHSLRGCTGTVSLQGGANVNISVSGNTITISAAANTNAVAASLWPAFILGG